MNLKEKNKLKRHTVTAIVREEGMFKAVCLSKKKGALQVLWTRKSKVEETNLKEFAQKCGIDINSKTKDLNDGEVLVAGFDSTGVIFYRLNVPSVSADEMERLVRLQTESRLPVSAEQLEICYRAGENRNGQSSITVAAAKKETLQRFVEEVRPLRPARILLDCEGIVKTWCSFFGAGEQETVLISIGSRCSRICLVKSSKLINAAIVDIGIKDFSEEADPDKRIVTADRFVRDISNVLELFGSQQRGVYVLSHSAGGDEKEIRDKSISIATEIAGYLESVGLNAKVSDFRFPVSGELSGEEKGVLYDYYVPVGLGLIELESDKQIDIFSRLYKPAGAEEKKHWLYSLKTACIVLGAMIVLAIISVYLLDVLTLKVLDYIDVKSSMDYGELIEKEKLMETVVRYRPDMLELINQFNSVETGGIMLSSIDFKRGQAIKIQGTSPDNDKLYKFQEDLEGLKDIREVRIISAPQNEKSKKIEFTINFHYKNFTSQAK